MNTPVSMYYANLTNIDLAMIMPDGKLRGDSFNLHLELTGQEDPVESVLIDFSTAKKQIKGWIDDHKGNGFDHKCWVFVHPDIHQNITIDIPELEDGVAGQRVKSPGSGTATVETPYTKIEAPANCFRFITYPEEMALNTRTMIELATIEMGAYLVQKFKETGQDIRVSVKLTNNFSYPAFAEPELEGFTFRYTHGLKHSTSFGCQNIAHGHASYITFKENPGAESFYAGSREFYKEQIEQVVAAMNNKVFVWSENVYHSFKINGENYLVIAFDSPRGFMRQTHRVSDCIVLNVETTVEHIAQYVSTTFSGWLQELNVHTVYVSEGLEKGGSAEVGGTYDVMEITDFA